ncbi:MAG TPA: hypothetical protein VG328_05025 [Stellaceae bacterium]|jgi:hypothetical protein|nr:hypothetical protein [Stellaceae bacterium]
MTLPQVTELLDYWRKHPPAHLLLAASLGLHETRERDEDFAALMALAPDGVLRGGKS